MNKLFTKKFALVMALLMVFSSFALFACSNKEDSTDSTDATDTSKVETTQAPASEDEATVDQNLASTTNDDAEPEDTTPVLAKVYKATSAYDNGKAKDLVTVYGSGFTKSKNELILNEDGTFTIDIGVTADPNSAKGTYKLISDSVIELCYDNDTTEEATITLTDGYTRKALELRFTKDNYVVLFTPED